MNNSKNYKMNNQNTKRNCKIGSHLTNLIQKKSNYNNSNNINNYKKKTKKQLKTKKIY